MLITSRIAAAFLPKSALSLSHSHRGFFSLSSFGDFVLVLLCFVLFYSCFGMHAVSPRWNAGGRALLRFRGKAD